MDESSGLLIFHELAVPIAKLHFIENLGNGLYHVGITDSTGNGITWKKVSAESYRQMLENRSSTKTQQDEIAKLNKRIEILERHISTALGNIENP